MNRAQRIVLVIALGIGMIAVAITANLVMTDPLEPSWFELGGPSPSPTDGYFIVASDRSIIEQALVWLLALATWAGASVWLLRTPGPAAPATREGSPAAAIRRRR